MHALSVIHAGDEKQANFTFFNMSIMMTLEGSVIPDEPFVQKYASVAAHCVEKKGS